MKLVDGHWGYFKADHNQTVHQIMKLADGH